MTDETFLPDDDRDRRLAGQIGAHLDRGTAPEDAATDPADAALLSALADLRAAHTPDALPAEATARVWARIEAGMRRHEVGRRLAGLAVLRTLLNARRLGTLGVVVIAAGLAWLLFMRTPASAVVAAAGDTPLEHTLADGSVVTLRPHSTLYALDSDEAAHRYQLDGEAFFDVTPDPARTFSVEGGNGRVSVLGTRFDFSTWGGAAAVYLEEGRVRFAHLRTDEAVTLAPGQFSRLADDTLASPAPTDGTEALDWMRGELSFAQTPLGQILDELALHYAVTFEVAPALRDETFTGRVLLAAPAKAFADLAIVMGGRFVLTEKGTYRFEAE